MYSLLLSQDYSPSAVKKVVASYVGYSMAHHLRKYITPKSEQLDPELDVEAHFSSRAVRDARSKIVRKERLRCITGWLWGKVHFMTLEYSPYQDLLFIR